jgi:hypothetical protein
MLTSTSVLATSDFFETGSPFMTVSPSTLHSYFVLVPNLFNLPNSIFGMGVSMRVKALTLFASSKTAGCNYCSLHVYVFTGACGTLEQRSPTFLRGINAVRFLTLANFSHRDSGMDGPLFFLYAVSERAIATPWVCAAGCLRKHSAG